MNKTADFVLHDVSDFPIVRLSGRALPQGYGPQWAIEMETLLRQGKPFVLLFPDTVQDESHEDQKLRAVWLKKNKRQLASLCRGVVSVEPDRALRLLKRAQGAALALAFGLKLKIVPDRERAEQIAKSLFSGEAIADDDE